MSSRPATRLNCFCGRTYANPIDLEEHRRARGHFASHVCKANCQHLTGARDDGRSHECGHCGKICERLDVLEDHRIFTGHCYCSECDLIFESQNALNIHRETEVHASEFRCCNCDISFEDMHALNAHMMRSVHRKPVQQNPPKKAKETTAVITENEVCTECQRTFESSQALQQHCESVKHKPLSSLSCPIGQGCRGIYTSPSALLHHLESGKCKSGMNRDEISRIVQASDHDNIIHSPPALAPSTPLTFSSYNTTPPSELSMDSLDDQSDWSLLTPSPSQGSLEGSLAQWSLLEDRQILFEGGISVDTMVRAKLHCSLCPKGSKSFVTREALEQHMDSPVHCAKIYHCPSNIFPNASSKAQKQSKKEKQFSTLSGLTQHLESGACHGGKRTFFYCIDLIQSRLEQMGFGGMRLLSPGYQS
jgi:hypothetical protein